jgi:2-polyprenyl-3-methyl-5-hydroxy-6-metoxy-1,4-benzoquinol methylase
MTVQSVAIIFDDTLRPETTGVYCRRALRHLAEVRHFLPAEASQIPRAGFDLYLWIDDGLRSAVPSDLGPRAFWAIDTHVNFDGCLEQARHFDFVFAAQRDGAEQLRRHGIESAVWLPLACDPDVHRKMDVDKTTDVCFVGNLFPGPRADLVELIQKQFPNSFVGRRYFAEMAECYSASRIVFNRSIRNDVNMRVFEAAACGSLLLTNELRENSQEELFRDGVHLATYASAEELLDKIRYYLAHEGERERIAAAGRAEAIARHTYRQRMERLLNDAAKGWKPRTNAAAIPTRPPVSGCVALSPHTPAEATSELTPVRDASYFEFARPELLALIPASARRVLDVGCGAGRLGEALKARQPAEVVGIEFDEQAAAGAKSRLDRVLVGDVEKLQPDFAAGSFDAVICGDILEHLRDPRILIERVRTWLKPDGCLIASIPNVRHHSVVSSLLAGNWTYESAGLLDRDHVQFFTRREIEALFRRSGFTIRERRMVPGPGYDEWARRGCPGEVKVGRLQISNLPPDEAQEFFVYQYLVTATPIPRPQTQDGRRRDDSPCRMRFAQDFVTDFDQFDFFGPPFAFARFGDGERAICAGTPIVSQDGWSYDGKDSPLAAELNAALRYGPPDYYLGISDGCCDKASRDWYLERINVPLSQVTFANIFVNGNYRRFRELDLGGAAIVSCRGGDFTVPEDVLRTPFDSDALVERLLAVDRPILVSAGPAAAVVIHKYWRRAPRKQVIVDVGSAIDELTKGCKTRRYQVPGTRTYGLICRW